MKARLGGEAAVLAAANGVEGVTEVAHDVELVEDDTCLWCMAVSEARKGFHMSVVASWMRAVFLVPSVAKKRSMSASVRPSPPTRLAACDRDR